MIGAGFWHFSREPADPDCDLGHFLAAARRCSLSPEEGTYGRRRLLTILDHEHFLTRAVCRLVLCATGRLEGERKAFEGDLSHLLRALANWPEGCPRGRSDGMGNPRKGCRGLGVPRFRPSPWRRNPSGPATCKRAGGAAACFARRDELPSIRASIFI